MTRAEEKGGGPSSDIQQPIKSGAENRVCLLCLLCFLLQTQARGVMVSQRKTIPADCKKKKSPLVCLNIYIHCDLERIPQIRKFMWDITTYQ